LIKLPSSFKKFQADVDNSGTIDYGEFVAAMLHLNKVQKEDHLFAAFSYFDKDGSGYITADELQQACEQFGLEDVQLEDIISEVDQDNVSDFPTNCLFYFHHPSPPILSLNSCEYKSYFCAICVLYRMGALIIVSLWL
jgi:hypothetical protein